MITSLNAGQFQRIRKWLSGKDLATLRRTPNLERLMATVAKHGWEGGPNAGDPPLSRVALSTALVDECLKWARNDSPPAPTLAPRGDVAASAYDTGDGT